MPDRQLYKHEVEWLRLLMKLQTASPGFNLAIRTNVA
jgi:hypothetical protein